MQRKITLITGGQRSGKSRFAMEMALNESPNPVYVATSRVYDAEHAKRIERHKAERAKNDWKNVEEDLFLSDHKFDGEVVLVDCVTLWANNVYLDNFNDLEDSLEFLRNQFNSFVSWDSHFIFVTNEIGSCDQSLNAIQREFTSLLGWFNQYVASKSDEVYHMVSGIPVKIK